MSLFNRLMITGGWETAMVEEVSSPQILWRFFFIEVFFIYVRHDLALSYAFLAVFYNS